MPRCAAQGNVSLSLWPPFRCTAGALLWAVEQHSSKATCAADGRTDVSQAGTCTPSAAHACVLEYAAQVLDVGCKDLMANAFAEASILDSLRGWPGCVQMLACGRTAEGQVRTQARVWLWSRAYYRARRPASQRVTDHTCAVGKPMHLSGTSTR